MIQNVMYVGHMTMSFRRWICIKHKQALIICGASFFRYLLVCYVYYMITQSPQLKSQLVLHRNEKLQIMERNLESLILAAMNLLTTFWKLYYKETMRFVGIQERFLSTHN